MNQPPKDDFINVCKQVIIRLKKVWLDGFAAQASHISLLRPSAVIYKCLLNHMKYDLSKETRV